MLQGILIGFLGADAEPKSVNGKDFVTFRVANTDRWTSGDGVVHEDTTWVDCIINGKPEVTKYLKRGTQVFVSGSESLRVYSSKKDRCMKAGLTINVKQVELLGGKSDDVPSILYTADGGQQVDVSKWYYAKGMQRNPDAPEFIDLVSKSGKKYIVDRNGWVVAPSIEDTQQVSE